MIVKGITLWAGTKERATQTYVAAVNSETQSRSTVVVSDEDGRFSLSLGAGAWQLSAVHEDGRQDQALPIEIPADQKETDELPVAVEIHSLVNTVSQGWGTFFFILVIALLGSVIAAWIWTHREYPDPKPPTMAARVLNLAGEARYIVDKQGTVAGNAALSKIVSRMEDELDNAKTSGDLKVRIGEAHDWAERIGAALLPPADRALKILNDLEADLSESDLAGQERAPIEKALKQGKDDLAKQTDPYESEGLDALIRLLEPAGSAVDPLKADYSERFGWRKQGRDKAAILPKAKFGTQIAKLELSLASLAQAEAEAAAQGSTSLFWSSSPKIYIEIVFWALIGSLVRLVFVTHQYLRWRRFYLQGIYQHVALLITVPILTLVFMVVISMAKLTAEDSSVVLDLSDPRIVAGASFLIALAPWRLWERLLGSARKIVGGRDSDS